MRATTKHHPYPPFPSVLHRSFLSQALEQQVKDLKAQTAQFLKQVSAAVLLYSRGKTAEVEAKMARVQASGRVPELMNSCSILRTTQH